MQNEKKKMSEERKKKTDCDMQSFCEGRNAISVRIRFKISASIIVYIITVFKKKNFMPFSQLM